MLEFEYQYLIVLDMMPIQESKSTKSEINDPSMDYYDANMRNYINTIVAYNFLHNEYLEDINSGSNEIKNQSDKYWEGIAEKLEENIMTTYQKLISENNLYIDDAKQIFRKTLDNKIQLPFLLK